MTEDLVQQMVGAARLLLDALDAEQRGRLHRPFTDEDLRRDWNYVPGEREGLSFDDLERPQRKAVHRLLASGLAPHVYAQIAVIMALEDVLDQQEGGRLNRHRSNYSTLVFGEPDEDGPWGWRFEGHHVSVNLTVVDGRLSATPGFLGANPAAVRYAGAAVVRPLAQEEDLARALVTSLEPAALAGAVVADEAPGDIRTTSRPRVDGVLEPRGVAATELRGTSADLLEQLVMLYVERLPRPLAVQRVDRLEREGFGVMHFAWAGSPEPGRPHYYCLQGPALLVEYDNQQNSANHIHTVWRDPDGDFGDDLLRASGRRPPLAFT